MKKKLTQAITQYEIDPNRSKAEKSYRKLDKNRGKCLNSVKVHLCCRIIVITIDQFKIQTVCCTA